MQSFAGKTAVITGGAGGIGMALGLKVRHRPLQSGLLDIRKH